MVYTNQSLYRWHTNRFVTPNERLKNSDKKRQGYFVFHNDVWYLVNESMANLINASTKESYPLGSQIEITEGINLLIGNERGDRLLNIQMVDSK